MAINGCRLSVTDWEAVWNDDRPWLEGVALQVALTLGLRFREWDHVILGGGDLIQSQGPAVGQCLIEAVSSGSSLGSYLARHGPSPGYDWGVWMEPKHVVAWRPALITRGKNG